MNGLSIVKSYFAYDIFIYFYQTRKNIINYKKYGGVYSVHVDKDNTNIIIFR